MMRSFSCQRGPVAEKCLRPGACLHNWLWIPGNLKASVAGADAWNEGNCRRWSPFSRAWAQEWGSWRVDGARQKACKGLSTAGGFPRCPRQTVGHKAWLWSLASWATPNTSAKFRTTQPSRFDPSNSLKGYWTWGIPYLGFWTSAQPPGRLATVGVGLQSANRAEGGIDHLVWRGGGGL